MTVSAVWIRDNMLRTSDQCERQLSEAELKVQKSLEKLSIPEWYLNKRSNPPKILRNVIPIESRPPSWKTAAAAAKRKSIAAVALPSRHSVTYTVTGDECNDSISTRESGMNQIPTCQCPETKLQKYSKCSADKNEEVFDTSIPVVGLPRNISGTFPKVSPSRKIRNINIVLPPAPTVNILDAPYEDLDNNGNVESKYSTFILKKQPKLENGKIKEIKNNEDLPWERVDNLRKKPSNSVDILNASFGTPNVKTNFQLPAVSTPKFVPAKLFSSTVIEDATVVGEVSPSFLDNSSILGSTKTNISQSLSGTSDLAIGTQKKDAEGKKRNLFLECSIRSIDPILFEKDNDKVLSLQPMSSFSSVREIVKRFDCKNEQLAPRRKHNHDEEKWQINDIEEKRSNLCARKEQATVNDVEKKESEQNFSPCTRFLHSQKKSTLLENIVKSKQIPRGKGHVQEIIEELNEKCRFSSTARHPSQPVSRASNQNLVKNIVTALEKGNTLPSSRVRRRRGQGRGGSGRRKSSGDEDAESCSEADSKTSVSCASISLKDTDSSSDYEQRSPSFKSEDESRFDYEITENEDKSAATASKIDALDEEQDSVYWIPVSSKCRLPRTSSLLSIMSRLSGARSPCVSPIRSESETSDLDNGRNAAWGATFGKNSNAASAVSKKLFRIDETVVVDSGYSDKSDRCSSGSSTADSNDFELEPRSSRSKKSSRRKTIVCQQRDSCCSFDN